MIYIFIPIMAVIIFFAIKKQNSLKVKMKGVKFYEKESIEIAKTIIPENDAITFISCGTNMDTLMNKRIRTTASGATTQNFKYTDYTIVAKTDKHIYFIPVKIVGTRKYTLEINPKLDIKTYDILNVRHKILKEKPNASWPSIDIEYNINNVTTNNVQFYGISEEFK